MADTARFAHLHVHSEYSLLDGCMSINKLIDFAGEMKLPAVALTDHGGMYGAVEFYKKARKAGIKPIVGCEVYVARGSRAVKSGGKDEAAGIHHLVLLSKNETGYRNLMKLVSLAHIEGFYYKPRMDKADLAAHSEGLICLSACISGEIPSLVLANRLDDARRAIHEYQAIFGDDNYFIEIQENTLPEQKAANAGLIQLANERGIPLVATNDCHYAAQEDADAHDILLCIQTNRRFDEPDRMRMSADEFFLKTPERMQKDFSYCPEAVTNTVHVADLCNLELDLETPHMPAYHMPPELKLTEREYLEKITWEGAAARYPEITPAVRERIEFELDILRQTGYESYYLIVRDVIMEARRRGISCGIRGSGNASVVAYCIGIIDLEPMRFNLLFERLLNPQRVTPPDFDIDLADVRRAEMIDYLMEKYGADRVAQISTFSRLGARQSLRDVGRALGMSLADVDRIAKLIGDDPKATIDKALEQNPELHQIAESDPLHRRLFNTARALSGITRQTSIHAAGIIVADRELTHYTPLLKPKSGPLATQYEFPILETMGMFKIDLLGLKTLTQIEECLCLVRRKGIDLTRLDIPFEDEATYQLLQEGRTNGVFQLESEGMKEVLRKFKPTQLTDIIAVVSLYRPGPMDMIDNFIDRKHGRAKIEYALPELEPLLKETYGVIVYQEQVMQIANVVAGMSLGQADLMRRAMGKKKPEELEKMKQVFLDGAAEQGVSRKVADDLFHHIEKFAGYGFNKSHATAYAIVSIQTAYLKANHFVEFMASTLTNDMHDTEKILKYVREAKEAGVTVLPPDINRSERNFNAEDGAIRFGLGGVKNVGGGPIDEILRAREEGGPFKSLDDFCERVSLACVNSKTFECLIRCGAFDGWGAKRSSLLATFPDAVKAAQNVQRDREKGQTSFFDLVELPAPAATPLPDLPELPESERLQDEKELLGIYVSGHPLERYLREIRLFAESTSARLLSGSDKDKERVRIVGVVTQVERRLGDSGPWARATLEDLEGTFEVMLWADAYQKYGPYVEKDKVVVADVTRRVNDRGTSFIVNRIEPVESVRDSLIQMVHVRIRTDTADETLMSALCDTIRRHRGSKPLMLHVATPRHGIATVQTAERFAVSPSDVFVEAVENLLEPGAVGFTLAPVAAGGNGRRKEWSGRAKASQ